MSPPDILRSSTVGGALVLGRSKDLGDVAPGKSADLVLLDADPLLSSANLSRTSLVIRAGRVFETSELTPSR
jgi:imidazolonepropionase-like amidohydrolase